MTTQPPDTIRSLPVYVQEHPKCNQCMSCALVECSVNTYECLTPMGNSATDEPIYVTPETHYCSNHSALRGIER